jgi:hypothetical protein
MPRGFDCTSTFVKSELEVRRISEGPEANCITHPSSPSNRAAGSRTYLAANVLVLIQGLHSLDKQLDTVRLRRRLEPDNFQMTLPNLFAYRDGCTGIKGSRSFRTEGSDANKT